MVRPLTITLNIHKKDLVSAICSTAESEGEKADYNYWLRCYLRKQLNVRSKAKRVGAYKK